MLGTILTLGAIYCIGSVVADRKRTKVRHSTDFFGSRHTTVDGPCFQCDGTGKVYGQTCRKCGGSDRFHRKY